MRYWQILRDWILIVAILAGIAGYFAAAALSLSDTAKSLVLNGVSVAQPLLIFAMLFLTFVRIDIHEIRPCGWNGWLLLFQAGLFTAVGAVLIALPHSGLRVVLEGVMICVICPTATAAAVVTRKLGGSMAHVTTYTIIINLAAAILIPALVPLVHPQPGLSMLNASLLILGKVFPLLLLPLVLGMLTARLLPAVKVWLERFPDLAFYIWAVSLALAIAVTTRSIVHTQVGLDVQLWLVGVSAATCALQFYVGRRIGRRYGDAVTAGQALGQKNTVFAIWVGYTFFSPVTAIVGGFYSIFHNLVNSRQLYLHKSDITAKG